MLLCLAAMLVFAYGHQTYGAPSMPAVSGAATSGINNEADRQGAPGDDRRPFVTLEWQSAKALAAEQEGKPKPALQPLSAFISKTPPRGRQDISVPYARTALPQHRYEARAPPPLA